MMAGLVPLGTGSTTAAPTRPPPAAWNGNSGTAGGGANGFGRAGNGGPESTGTSTTDTAAGDTANKTVKKILRLP
jgi:hypothetical protein